MRPADSGRRRTGKHVSPRRRLSLSAEAWALLDGCAEHQAETWLEWARGKLAIAAAQELGVDESEMVALFDRE